MSTTAVMLEPLDTLFFRDGTPFGAATRAETRKPLPQTLAGAVFTSLLSGAGCDFNALKDRLRAGKSLREAFQELCGAGWIADVRVRGPWFARSRLDEPLEVLVPAPATLHGKKKQAGRPETLHRLKPLRSTRKLPGWQPLRGGMRPLWLTHADVTEPAGGFLTLTGLQRFLDDKNPLPEEWIGADELFGFDHRTGIGIDPDRLSAEASQIYGVSFLALRPHYTAPVERGGDSERKPQTVLYAEVVLPPGHESANPFANVETLALGGEGRRVRVQPVQPVEWPRVEPANGRGPVLVLTTPAPFKAVWLPSFLDRPGLLAAAAVPGSVAVSGWDLARGGPKATRFAAEAGSVYFLDRRPDAELPASLADERPEDALQGWGCFVQGVWTDE